MAIIHTPFHHDEPEGDDDFFDGILESPFSDEHSSGEEHGLREGLHCMSNLDGLSRLPSDFADFIMYDGPYFISKPGQSNTTGYKGTKYTNFGEWDHATVGSLAEEFDQCARIMRYGASMIVWSGWEVLGDLKNMLAERGLYVKRKVTIINKSWHPMMAARGWMSGEENGLWVTKSKGWHDHTFRHVGPSANWCYSQSPKGDDRIHDCQKSDDVYYYYMQELLNPNKGEVVVEPYAGSAPAYRAAKTLGCRYFGFEKNEEAVLKARAFRGIPHHGG